MIHTLIIRPSRVELVLKTFSTDYNKLSEKKLISKEFSFRFNREIIDTGAYYKSFYRILADILQPYKKDIKQLQISLRSSFFQVRSIQCDENMCSDQDYLNWEIDKTINDISEHFNYGIFYEKSIKTLHLFIVRKSVDAYFNDILRKIISDDNNYSIGYNFITESKDSVFISTNKSIEKPFGASAPSSIRMWNIPTEKIRAEVKFKRTIISTIILSLLLAAFYLTYFQSENLYKLYSNMINHENTDTPTKTNSEEKFLKKLFEDEMTEATKEESPKEIKILNIHDILDSLISHNPKSVIFEYNNVLVQFFNKNSSTKFVALANKYNIPILKKSQEYLSFQLGDDNADYSRLTKKDYEKARKILKLDSKKSFMIMNDQNKFYRLTDILLKNNKIFDKFVVSKRGDKLFLAGYFD